MVKKNESRVILVTGGTRGIGAAIAAKLHERGHRVYVTQRAQAESGRREGPQVLSLDITSTASVDDCVQELLRREGRIDVLVNNAGYDLFGAVLETQGTSSWISWIRTFSARRAWFKPCCRTCSSDALGASSTSARSVGRWASR